MIEVESSQMIRRNYESSYYGTKQITRYSPCGKKVTLRIREMCSRILPVMYQKKSLGPMGFVPVLPSKSVQSLRRAMPGGAENDHCNNAKCIINISLICSSKKRVMSPSLKTGCIDGRSPIWRSLKPKPFEDLRP